MAAVTHSDFSDVTAGITALLLFYHECIISVKGKKGKKSRKIIIRKKTDVICLQTKVLSIHDFVLFLIQSADENI